MIKKIIFYNAVLFIVGLIIVEFFFGGWFAPSNIHRLNILWNVDYKYDVSRLYNSTNQIIRYKRDKYGLRGTYGNVSSIDILTVGGSATDQRYITEGEMWQDILRKDFEKDGKSVSVVNAGVDGQSTYGNIKDFELWFLQIPNFKAKYVLVYVGTNDIYADEGLHNDDVSGSKTLKSVIKSKSALYKMYRTLVGMYLARFRYPISHRAIDFKKVEWTDKALNNDHAQNLSEKFVAYEDRLKDLIGRIRKIGAKPIIVTQASRMYKVKDGKVVGLAKTMDFHGEKINGMDYYYVVSLLNKKTIDICKGEGAICIDLARELNFDDDEFYDYFHNTPKGTEKVGHYLYSKLNGIIDKDL